jgi:hypothetical protein
MIYQTKIHVYGYISIYLDFVYYLLCIYMPFQIFKSTFEVAVHQYLLSLTSLGLSD